MNTKQKIENLHRAAFALEDDIRRGRMTMDCQSIDTFARKTGRGGFAVLIGDGKAEIIPLGETETHVREPTKEESDAFKSYEPLAAEAFRRAESESHEVERKAAGRFNPVHVEGPEHRRQPAEQKAPTADAARKAKMTADARRYNQDAFDRNARIAAQMKQRSKEIWKRRSA